MPGLRDVSDERLMEKYYLILNNRIDVPAREIGELQDELRRREIKQTLDDRQMEIFIRCLDVEKIRQYVKKAFST
jgi:hypothetical protein